MLETYDPDWSAKWDAAREEYAVLEAIKYVDRTPDQVGQMFSLAYEMGRLCDIAALRTPNEYLRRHLYHVLKDAADHGIPTHMPTLNDGAGIDATYAVIADMTQRVKRAKAIIAVHGSL